jgi:hypothetical protein
MVKSTQSLLAEFLARGGQITKGPTLLAKGAEIQRVIGVKAPAYVPPTPEDNMIAMIDLSKNNVIDITKRLAKK